jgi:hypothetical protein
MIPHSKQPDDFDKTIDVDGGQEPTDEALAAFADFSDEERVLARSLHDFFPLEQEQLPPRFVQTLAAQGSAWAAPNGLEQRVIYRVFRRLHLPQRLFPPQPPGAEHTPRRPGRASRTVVLSTLLTLMLLSLATVTPALAQGLRLLVGQTGVQIAAHYPRPAHALQDQTQTFSLQAVRHAVPFDAYWLGMTPAAYQFQGMVLHMGQPWADGPVVELQYKTTDPGVRYGQLLVREFHPAAGATILQVVAQGAAHLAQVGTQPAIYIDGQWVQQHQAVVWNAGTQAELLYQAHGLIFWITANQRAGAGEALLEGLAQMLEPLYLGQPRPRLADLIVPTSAQVASALSAASLGEVLALIQAGSSPATGAAVYIALGSPPDALN